MSAYRQHTCQASGANQAQMWRVFYCPDAGGETGMKYAKPALSFEQQADQLDELVEAAARQPDLLPELVEELP